MTPGATDELVREWTHDDETSTPNLLGQLEAGAVSGAMDARLYFPVLPTPERMAELDEVAEWSVTSAELDWDHAEDIDRRGWGLDPA